MDVFEKAIRSIKERPASYYPFICVACLEFLFLVLIVLAPRPPLNRLLAPPISAFYGPQYLHYPAHYILVAYLFFMAQLWLSIFVGSFATGTSVAFLTHTRKKADFEAVVSALKKYSTIVGTSLCTAMVLFIFSKLAAWFTMNLAASGYWMQIRTWVIPILILTRFIFTIIIHAYLVFAIPVIIVERSGIIKSLRRSIRLCRQHFSATVAMVGMPMFVLFPIVMLQNRPAYIIDHIFPEAVLLVCIANILVSSLVVAPVITAAATLRVTEPKL